MGHIDPKLLEKYAAGECTAEESQQVEKWLSLEQDLPLDATSDLSQADKADLEKQLWSGIESERNVIVPHKKWFNSKYILSAAACMALAISAIVYLTARHNAKSGSPEMLVREAGKGRLDTLLLSDGSRVILNAGAKLQYPKEFKGRLRELSLLEGEAFFEVQKNAAKPFLVHTDQTTVRVLGTKFNINKLNKNISVTLTEGRVAFSQGKDSVLLTPGQRAVYTLNKGITPAENIETARYVSWQLGTLWFEDTPMDEVLETLAKRYNLGFKVERKDLHVLLFTGKISSNNEADALKLIMMSSDVRFKSAGGRALRVY